ncbi:BMP family ABC transporter substrate-binding protein [Tissierella creatinini]|nr:BMP family ABC transporter substrate-binding protein [Tissierella creatinini]TJX64330.1 BMP family ABC transporter substrate-binding protein [Soehngenia saccharolytica]
MKKFSKLAALALAATITLTGCATPKNGGGETPAETPAETGSDKTKVAVVINTNLGDKAFSDLVWSGVTRASEDLDLEIKAFELLGDATKQEPTLIELSESGEWDLIVSGTFNLKEATQAAALEFPEQKYLVYDTQVDYDQDDYSNVVSVMSKQNEGSFLAGALAAKLTSSGVEGTNEEKVIGFVGGGENSAINDFLVGYIEGAKYVDPEVKVLYSYIGDFTNTAKGKELALAQYQQGADVVFAVAGAASLGALNASKDAGRLAIGVDQDHALKLEESDPETSKHIVTSVMKNLDVLLYDKITEYKNGTIEWGKHLGAGLAENGMSLADNKYYREIVPAEIITEIEGITEKIKSGEIKVSTAIGMSTEEVNAIKEKAGK